MAVETNYFRELGLETIKQLETDRGILASGRNELFGCIFGRDTLITSLKLLRVYKKTKDSELKRIVRKALINLAALQGREVNIESGEQPGKNIHEFRPDNHERLTKYLDKPWYVYHDSAMRNYDTADATSLFLIAAYRYWQYSGDDEFVAMIMSNIKAAINWHFEYGDSNGDGFMDYQLSPQRTYGGLVTQNWMDSVESVFHETEGHLFYPMAPVEVQAYAYLAYRLWARFFGIASDPLSAELEKRAQELKQAFNQKFVTEDPDGNIYLAWKLDGEGVPFRSVRSNMGHVLWASLNKSDDGTVDSIVDQKYVGSIVKRLMMKDMFEPEAGIRTLSTYSRNFKPNSYHNGSIWPHDKSLIAEGFEIHGFVKEALQVKDAVLKAILNFKTPIELFVYMDDHYANYCSAEGQEACKTQAWSAAAILDFAT
jgi:glycogen debranching enzyme